MKPNKKDSIATWSAVAMLVWGVILTSSAFCVPPVGQVHDSVLWIMGQVLIYSGSIFGIVTYTKGRLDEIDKRVNSQLQKDKEEEE